MVLRKGNLHKVVVDIQDDHSLSHTVLLTARQALFIYCGAAHDFFFDVQWERLPYPFFLMWWLIALKST